MGFLSREKGCERTEREEGRGQGGRGVGAWKELGKRSREDVPNRPLAEEEKKNVVSSLLFPRVGRLFSSIWVARWMHACLLRDQRSRK